jgi:hypothetical protein
MEQVDQGKFSCQQCGKSYKWKPEFAGRKVKCKCGFTMTAPKEPPGRAAAASDEPDLDALYSLADEGKQAAKSGAVEAAMRCPSCKSALEPGASVCATCGFNLKTGTKAAKSSGGGGGGGGARVAGVAGVAAAAAVPGGTSAFSVYGQPKRGLQKEDRGEDKTLDFYIPIGMIAVGFILTVLISTKFSGTVYDLPTAAMHAGLKMVLGFVLLAIGGIFCVKWGEIAFGDPASAALKLAGFALLPPAVAGIISFLVHDAPPTGWGLVGFFLAFGMFFIASHYLFEWDMSEKWVVTGMSTVVCMLAVPFVFQFIIHGGQIPGLAASASNNEDAEVDYSVYELGGPKPANEWMDFNKGRLLGSFPRPDSEQLINDLYALGPKKGEIWIAAESKTPNAAEVYVLLPGDSKKRKAMFDLVSKWNLAHGRSVMKDEGGKWMIIVFLPYVRPHPL